MYEASSSKWEFVIVLLLAVALCLVIKSAVLGIAESSKEIRDAQSVEINSEN